MNLILNKIIAILLRISVLLLIASCSHISLELNAGLLTTHPSDTYLKIQGRLALNIEPENPFSDEQPKRFSGEFELEGSPKQGSLQLYTPLGTTLATLKWSPQLAQMQTSGGVQNFDSLDSMLQQATGAALPATGLFAWLQGQALDLPGWLVDLSQHGRGRISAKRTAPAPALELRVIVTSP